MGGHHLKDATPHSVVREGQSPVIRLHQSRILALFRAFDCFVILFMLWGVLNVVGVPLDNGYTFLGVLSIILFGFFAESNEVYYLWRGLSTPKLASRLLAAWAATALVTFTVALLVGLVKSVDHSAVLTWIAVTPVAMVFLHWARREFLSLYRGQRTQPRRVAVAGANRLGSRLVESMEGIPWMGYQVTGYYDDRAPAKDMARRLEGEEINVCGGFDQLFEDARDGKIDIIFVTLPMKAEDRIREMVDRLADTTASVYLIPDVFSFNLVHSRLTGIQGIPALSIYDTPLVDHGWSKRLEDVLLSLAILTLIAIPMLIIAAGVKLSSPGPVFFKQTRYGMRGEKIKVWKFRSMSVCEDGPDVPQAQKEDPRITPFGGFLRRTSLDELPQFFNVLGGTMSIVGPRPHAVAHNEFYRGQIQGYMLRHKVKPGITGLAQINGFRGETDTMDLMTGRIDYDLEYIRNWSLWLDLKIVWFTIFRGFVGQQAY